MADWSISVVSDVMITTTLVLALRGQRSRTPRKTAALEDKLIFWTIETGVLTSVSNILMLVFFVTMRDNFVWMAFFAITTRLFSNFLLARHGGAAYNEPA
ncbi:hypothetical protein K438DRAFT_1971617 [Mycena galopus ATCC 62051]|nr:hypothetical protein K438DRAFT_1971617 [Mycena galopus ATCC 62051]